ncbi:MAG TPA: zinc-binding dehydrogenase [Steroidobacteraceae bacterium]|nr:zinc-binding dehydrogenase [Steroidobacteraceae bacterium]
MRSLRTVWRIDRAGSLDRLRLTEEDLPPPAAGEAQVAVRAVGLNFADALACLGLYSATPRGSFVPGLEAAGVIEALGAPLPGRNGRLLIGDRVSVLTRFGGYATRLNADIRYLQPIPTGWSFEQAAAFPVQTLTAWWGLMRLGEVRAGSAVLVQSAAGGVGLQALAILQRLGGRPVAVVGSSAKIEFLHRHLSLPRSSLVLRERGLFAARLDAALAALGAVGFDVVFDAVLGEWFAPCFERLAPEGRYVLFGAADFISPGARPCWPRLAWHWLRRPRLDPLAMISRNRGLLAFNLIWLWESVERVPEAYAALAALDLDPPHIGAQHPFAAVRTALAELQSGRTVGKSVLQVDGAA